MIDANQLPIIECNNSFSIENISKFISFFSQAFSNPSSFLLRTKIFSPGSDEEVLQEVIFKLRHSQQFKQIHTIKPDKVSYCDLLGNTWLHFACENEKMEVISGMLRSGCVVNQVNNAGFTPLMIAVITGNKDAVASLLANKANVNYAHTNGVTALFLAAQTGQYDIVKMLLEAGADKNMALTTTKMDALYEYVKGTQLEQVMRLFVRLKYQEKRERHDYDAKLTITPLEISVVMGHEAISKLLTEMGLICNAPVRSSL